ncbi:hypothetical protein ACOMDP_13515 [Pantoea dispersa]|uniref:hypothetical protein n=1 Tax=Pantoea dispersa TaxID=59814 RepID=UPI003B7C51EC
MKVEVHFLTETPFIIGIIMTVIGLFVMFLIFKPNKNELIEIKNWKTRGEWQGNVITIEPKSWSQTDTKYGNDFFYDFNVPLTVAGKENIYSGKGLVRPIDIRKLKKGIGVIVKYNEDKPPKVAIIDILY